jgi:hypothetical protein
MAPPASHEHFHGEVFDNLIPWLVQDIRQYGGDQAFGLVRSLMEMDDEERVAGRCGPGRDRRPWGDLFDDLFAPHQAAITQAVLDSMRFVEACTKTAAIVLPGRIIPVPTISRWDLPFWKWPSAPGA